MIMVMVSHFLLFSQFERLFFVLPVKTIFKTKSALQCNLTLFELKKKKIKPLLSFYPLE